MSSLRCFRLGTHIHFPNHRVRWLSSEKSLVLLSLINCRISFSFASSNCLSRISASKAGSTSIATAASFTIVRLRYLISLCNSGHIILAKVALQYFLQFSSHHVEHPFDLIHLDVWTSPVVSVSDSKYYLIILNDFTHYLCTFPLKLKSDTFTTLFNFFAYVYSIRQDCQNYPVRQRTWVWQLFHPHLPPVERHSSGCHVLTRLHKMVKLNVLFVWLTMSSALCWFRLLFPGVIRQKDFTQLHTC
jgi:hypothetical protein